MRIISWNVNSVRTRAARMAALLDRHRPDVLCLQETKVEDGGFPMELLPMRGYRAALHGQKTYNGVALVSKTKASDITRGFPNDPVPEQARVIAGTYEGVRVVDAYVVNGQAPGTDKFEIKLRWLDAFREFLRVEMEKGPLVVVGDFNIAPQDRDVHDPVAWAGGNLVSPEERAKLRAILDLGLVDLHRQHTEAAGVYTWWDYRGGGFHKDHGLRIDLALGSREVAERLVGVSVDREERKESSGEGKPSDHAPLIVDLA